MQVRCGGWTWKICAKFGQKYLVTNSLFFKVLRKKEFEGKFCHIWTHFGGKGLGFRAAFQELSPYFMQLLIKVLFGRIDTSE
jgi:hypothetical protein